MLSERSTQRMVFGGWNAVSSNSRLVLTPPSLTVLTKRVPTPTGPSVLLRISSTRGLKSLSFSPSATKAKTSSIGLSTIAVPWKRPPAMPSLFHKGIGSRHERPREPGSDRARAHGVREPPRIRRDDGHLQPPALRDHPHRGDPRRRGGGPPVLHRHADGVPRPAQRADRHAPRRRRRHRRVLAARH